MPLFSHSDSATTPDSVDDWRPQRFARRIRSVRDPIVEPAWSGVRVLVRLEPERVRIFDEEGIDCTEEFADLAQAITSATLSDQMILDGYLTVEPTQAPEGTSPALVEPPTSTRMMASLFLGDRAIRQTGRRARLDPDRPIAFVAVDLLEIDGVRLIELPLLERKRLLDGALRQDERVRVTPYVRPPIDSFGRTWRGLGFVELAYKGANSRYYPASSNDDWVVAPIPKR